MDWSVIDENQPVLYLINVELKMIVDIVSNYLNMEIYHYLMTVGENQSVL